MRYVINTRYICLYTWYITSTIYAHHVKGKNVLQRHWIPWTKIELYQDINEAIETFEDAGYEVHEDIWLIFSQMHFHTVFFRRNGINYCCLLFFVEGKHIVHYVTQITLSFVHITRKSDFLS